MDILRESHRIPASKDSHQGASPNREIRDRERHKRRKRSTLPRHCLCRKCTRLRRYRTGIRSCKYLYDERSRRKTDANILDLVRREGLEEDKMKHRKRILISHNEESSIGPALDDDSSPDRNLGISESEYDIICPGDYVMCHRCCKCKCSAMDRRRDIYPCRLDDESSTSIDSTVNNSTENTLVSNYENKTKARRDRREHCECCRHSHEERSSKNVLSRSRLEAKNRQELKRRKSCGCKRCTLIGMTLSGCLVHNKYMHDRHFYSDLHVRQQHVDSDLCRRDIDSFRHHRLVAPGLYEQTISNKGRCRRSCCSKIKHNSTFARDVYEDAKLGASSSTSKQNQPNIEKDSEISHSYKTEPDNEEIDVVNYSDDERQVNEFPEMGDFHADQKQNVTTDKGVPMPAIKLEENNCVTTTKKCATVTGVPVIPRVEVKAEEPIKNRISSSLPDLFHASCQKQNPVGIACQIKYGHNHIYPILIDLPTTLQSIYNNLPLCDVQSCSPLDPRVRNALTGGCLTVPGQQERRDHEKGVRYHNVQEYHGPQTKETHRIEVSRPIELDNTDTSNKITNANHTGTDDNAIRHANETPEPRRNESSANRRYPTLNLNKSIESGKTDISDKTNNVNHRETNDNKVRPAKGTSVPGRNTVSANRRSPSTLNRPIESDKTDRSDKTINVNHRGTNDNRIRHASETSEPRRKKASAHRRSPTLNKSIESDRRDRSKKTTNVNHWGTNDNKVRPAKETSVPGRNTVSANRRSSSTLNSIIQYNKKLLQTFLPFTNNKSINGKNDRPQTPDRIPIHKAALPDSQEPDNKHIPKTCAGKGKKEALLKLLGQFCHIERPLSPVDNIKSGEIYSNVNKASLIKLLGEVCQIERPLSPLEDLTSNENDANLGKDVEECVSKISKPYTEHGAEDIKLDKYGCAKRNISLLNISCNNPNGNGSLSPSHQEDNSEENSKDESQIQCPSFEQDDITSPVLLNACDRVYHVKGNAEKEIDRYSIFNIPCPENDACKTGHSQTIGTEYGSSYFLCGEESTESTSHEIEEPRDDFLAQALFNAGISEGTLDMFMDSNTELESSFYEQDLYSQGGGEFSYDSVFGDTTITNCPGLKVEHRSSEGDRIETTCNVSPVPSTSTFQNPLSSAEFKQKTKSSNSLETIQNTNFVSSEANHLALLFADPEYSRQCSVEFDRQCTNVHRWTEESYYNNGIQSSIFTEAQPIHVSDWESFNFLNDNVFFEDSNSQSNETIDRNTSDSLLNDLNSPTIKTENEELETYLQEGQCDDKKPLRRYYLRSEKLPLEETVEYDEKTPGMSKEKIVRTDKGSSCEGTSDALGKDEARSSANAKVKTRKRSDPEPKRNLKLRKDDDVYESDTGARDEKSYVRRRPSGVYSEAANGLSGGGVSKKKKSDGPKPHKYTLVRRRIASHHVQMRKSPTCRNNNADSDNSCSSKNPSESSQVDDKALKKKIQQRDKELERHYDNFQRRPERSAFVHSMIDTVSSKKKSNACNINTHDFDRKPTNSSDVKAANRAAPPMEGSRVGIKPCVVGFVNRMRGDYGDYFCHPDSSKEKRRLLCDRYLQSHGVQPESYTKNERNMSRSNYKVEKDKDSAMILRDTKMEGDVLTKPGTADENIVRQMQKRNNNKGVDRAESTKEPLGLDKVKVAALRQDLNLGFNSMECSRDICNDVSDLSGHVDSMAKKRHLCLPKIQQKDHSNFSQNRQVDHLVKRERGESIMDSGGKHVNATLCNEPFNTISSALGAEALIGAGSVLGDNENKIDRLPPITNDSKAMPSKTQTTCFTTPPSYKSVDLIPRHLSDTSLGQNVRQLEGVASYSVDDTTSVPSADDLAQAHIYKTAFPNRHGVVDCPSDDTECSSSSFALFGNSQQINETTSAHPQEKECTGDSRIDENKSKAPDSSSMLSREDSENFGDDGTDKIRGDRERSTGFQPQESDAFVSQPCGHAADIEDRHTNDIHDKNEQREIPADYSSCLEESENESDCGDDRKDVYVCGTDGNASKDKTSDNPDVLNLEINADCSDDDDECDDLIVSKESRSRSRLVNTDEVGVASLSEEGDRDTSPLRSLTKIMREADSDAIKRLSNLTYNSSNCDTPLSENRDSVSATKDTKSLTSGFLGHYLRYLSPIPEEENKERDGKIMEEGGDEEYRDSDSPSDKILRGNDIDD